MIYLPRSEEENRELAEWVMARVRDRNALADGFYETMAFMVDGEIAAVVLYSHYCGHDISITFAADNPRWCTRGNLATGLGYPFRKYPELQRISCTAAKKNKRSRRLIEKVGFEYEGNKRRGTMNGDDLICYGLLREKICQ